MGRMIRSQDAGIAQAAPDQLTDIDRFDYFHAMLKSLTKMMAGPETQLLRQVLCLATVEAERLLREAAAGTAPRPAAPGAAATPLRAGAGRH